MKILSKIYQQLRKSAERKNTRILAISGAGIILLVYLCLSLTAPVRTYRMLQKSTYADPQYIKDFGDQALHPTADSLLRRIAALKSKLKLAEGDSIGLIIDLRDSTISLVMHGVPIHIAEVRKVSVDNIIQGLELPVYYKLFSQPLTVVAEQTTVVKEPIIIKMPQKTRLKLHSRCICLIRLKKIRPISAFIQMQI